MGKTVSGFREQARGSRSKVQGQSGSGGRVTGVASPGFLVPESFFVWFCSGAIHIRGRFAGLGPGSRGLRYRATKASTRSASCSFDFRLSAASVVKGSENRRRSVLPRLSCSLSTTLARNCRRAFASWASITAAPHACVLPGGWAELELRELE